MPAGPPVITFLSDYGLRDDFVGICHGVIARLCPEARIIDITHGVRRHDARAGALTLAGALPYMPEGVHLAVVDPDVGAERRAVALSLADGRVLVGPDNGLLWLAAERSGGIVQAVDIARSPFRLEPVSATFHGRDIFAPVAAHLAGGAALGEAGDPIDPEELVRLELPRPEVGPAGLCAHVIYIDNFGNAALDASHEDLAQVGLRLGREVEVRGAGVAPGAPEGDGSADGDGYAESDGYAEGSADGDGSARGDGEADGDGSARGDGYAEGDGEGLAGHYARTFAEVPEGALLIYEDAHRRLAVAINHGDAARRLGVRVGDELHIRAA